MIDWQRVAELRDEVGAEDFDEVVALFLEEVDEVIERLQATPDPDAYEEDLHFLKGSALNLGFRAFAELCEAGERTAAAGQSGAVDIQAVIGFYGRSKAQFLEDQEKASAA